MADDTPNTVAEWERIGELRFELLDGDVYLGGLCLGHGPVVHALLELAANAPTPRPEGDGRTWQMVLLHLLQTHAPARD